MLEISKGRVEDLIASRCLEVFTSRFELVSDFVLRASCFAYCVAVSVACTAFIPSVMAAQAAAENDEISIAASPAAVREVERNEKIDIYRQVCKGDDEARKKWNDLSSGQRTLLLSHLAIKNEQSEPRKLAIQALAKMSPSDDPDKTSVVALARVAVAEKDASLRALARNGLIARQDDCTPALLEAVLHNADADIHSNAIAALRGIGGPRIFEVIIEHWRESAGPGPRGHIFSGQQRSYIKDYDVSGAVYQPVVSSFLTGVVLDCKMEHYEGDSYKYWIHEIAPDDAKIADNPAAWQKWLDKERPKLADEAKKKRAAAVAALNGKDLDNE
jgi:hypothetical protein